MHRIALVELYTSEGCSSCPPADRWLSALAASSLGPDRVLPLAFHVAYWDYIGWKDRFATPAHEERQRLQARRAGLRTIYTPQIVTDGRDLPSWYDAAKFVARVSEINATTAPLSLSLQASAVSGGDGTAPGATIRLRSGSVGKAEISEGAMLHLVSFENGLSSAVNRGENAGTTLPHDHVVRSWAKPKPWQDGRKIDSSLELPADLQLRNAGVAAFVQAADGAVLQATSCTFAALP